MYKKKDKKVMVIAALVVAVFLAAIYILPNYREIFGGREIQETEETEYEVLIHKTDAGRIDVKKALLKQDGETETKLSAPAGMLVSLSVTPRENKILSSVSVVDAKDFSMQYGTIINETKENTYTVDFSMPESDVVMTFTFENKEMPETEKQTEQREEKQTEEETRETEEGNPYGLRVHGITADLITSFNGQFDDRDFCAQLGDALHLDSPRSQYYGITDVTFSREEYTGPKDSDKVYYYIYFGEDPDFKMLSTYYLKDSQYVFTKYEQEEQTQKEEEGTSFVDGSSGSYTPASGSGSTSYPQSVSSGSPSVTSVTSFDILQVSKVFLDYTGDSESFYAKAFDYVLSKGLTGKITGTMSSYEINPDKRTATIVIKLNNGSTMKGTYKKEGNSFSFSGL